MKKTFNDAEFVERLGRSDPVRTAREKMILENAEGVLDRQEETTHTPRFTYRTIGSHGCELLDSMRKIGWVEEESWAIRIACGLELLIRS